MASETEKDMELSGGCQAVYVRKGRVLRGEVFVYCRQMYKTRECAITYSTRTAHVDQESGLAAQVCYAVNQQSSMMMCMKTSRWIGRASRVL
jgi:hypothetical protein